MSVNRIEGRIRTYAWGSRTALAALTGRPVPSEHPEAELWFGAHPGAPSPLEGTGETLLQRIGEDPSGQLGTAADGGRLPFLLKLLAADQALSLQAHPTLEQAKAGYAREEADGIPVTSPQRNYKDDNHKPELLVALTRFEALAGFRPVGATRALLAELVRLAEQHPQGGGGLGRHAELLDDDDGTEGLRALVTTWISLPSTDREELLSVVVPACRSLTTSAASGPDAWMGEAAQAAVDLADQYPGDAGVLVSLLLNHVVLSPGEAIFLSAGKLHAYLRGTGVEIMANSDNVLRGGLTSKHIDVPELMRVVDFAPSENPVLHADADGNYAVPVPEFRLRAVPGGGSVEVDGPAIVLVTGGGGAVSDPAGEHVVALASGQAAWVPADAGRTVATGSGDMFIAAVGR